LSSYLGANFWRLKNNLKNKECREIIHGVRRSRLMKGSVSSRRAVQAINEVLRWICIGIGLTAEKQSNGIAFLRIVS
jgi:hypothetical protein